MDVESGTIRRASVWMMKISMPSVLTGTNIISVRSVNCDDHTVFCVIQYVFQYYLHCLMNFLTLYAFTFNCSCCCIVGLTTMPSVIVRATGTACVKAVGSGTIIRASVWLINISVPSVLMGTNVMSLISANCDSHSVFYVIRTVFHFIPYVCHCICLSATCFSIMQSFSIHVHFSYHAIAIMLCIRFVSCHDINWVSGDLLKFLWVD